MIIGFFKKLIKYYIDKFIDWLRMKRFNLELDSDIKKFHAELDKKIKKPKIIYYFHLPFVSHSICSLFLFSI